LFFLTAANLEKYQGTKGPLKKKGKREKVRLTQRDMFLLVPKQHNIAKMGLLGK
jgi:hypothetical protein